MDWKSRGCYHPTAPANHTNKKIDYYVDMWTGTTLQSVNNQRPHQHTITCSIEIQYKQVLSPSWLLSLPIMEEQPVSVDLLLGKWQKWLISYSTNVSQTLINNQLPTSVLFKQKKSLHRILSTALNYEKVTVSIRMHNSFTEYRSY